MKILKIAVLLLLTSQLCRAQDTTRVLSADNLDKFNNVFYLGNFNGWIFKQGTDSSFAKTNVDTVSWIRLRPNQLSSKYADKNGRVEGWFRLKVKFDSSLLNKTIYFDFLSWSATEFYVDDELVATRGNTAEKDKGFREYNGDLDPVSMHFNDSTPHILSVHFVGYLSPFPPYELKSQSQLYGLVRLGGPNYITNSLKDTLTDITYSTSWKIVCAILCVLFWLLYFQNLKEKNLFWIALYTSALTIAMFCGFSSTNIGTTYNEYAVLVVIADALLFGIILLLLPILLIKVFKRELHKKLTLTLIILLLCVFSSGILPSSFSEISKFISTAALIFIFGVCLYYIITSWKNLRGAQWAIVVGLFLSILVLLGSVISSIILKNSSLPPYLNYSIQSAFFLSFPLSLLIYVSMRFREIIKEVQSNAKKVVELSDEKKILAENQQKILEGEVIRQTAEIRTTLNNLKSTQSQLIQSEKMASLGELTAGIAHEIQNPLNFVNNFSEVNTELIEEMKNELANGNNQQAIVLADDIKENEQKINHHGKRADAIVKGMLQHSRKNENTKEPIDINALCDEYLRLSYHGLRAKDKSFNASFNTNFDDSIGKINIIPQDIGRVILNLITNAFYAVDEKRKMGSEKYEPTVSVATKKFENHVLITVSDNGNGIPSSIKDKIFQPFFTTKPTGSGTGLGLSLSYDIVNAHGGEIKVESKSSEGSDFIIELPIV